jgi:hypothetical protein
VSKSDVKKETLGVGKMKEELSRCGYKCKICPAYKDNVSGKESQQAVSDGWFKIYGFRIPAEQCICDGCLPENCENPRRIDANCPIGPCVSAKGIPNCAYCDEYICEKLSQRIIIPKEVVSKCKEPVSVEDYDRFVSPYDNKTRLDMVRRELGKYE